MSPGESCLLHRFVRDEWRVLSSQTIGVEFSSKIVHIADRKSSSLSNRKRIKLQLWDTAGTERFRSVSRSYYRGAAGAILVYDVSSWRSFEQLQTFLNDARALAGPDITIILAGNKSDVVEGGGPPAGYSYASTPSSDYGLPPPTPSSQSSLGYNTNLNNHYTVAPEGREVSAEAASRWASANGIPVAVEVSALNGENVEELFNRLARMILTKIELGEIDPDDPQSGIQYGDLGWDDGNSSIRSGYGDGSVRWRGGKKKPRTEWEEVFRLSGGTRRGGGKLSLTRVFQSLRSSLPSSLPLKGVNPAAIANMTWLKNINPTPAFPAYTGPHKVGSIDVEIPTSELENPSDDTPPADLPTVAFRYTSIPVHQNADVLEPATKSKRWPVMMFSHGLGGSRNAYSHICGSLASHGIVVIAPDHRDGSSPINFIHTPDEKEKTKRVEYQRIDHKPSTDVYNARDEQLRIRLWEMGLIHDALLKIDSRHRLKNVAADATKNSGKDMLTMFSHLLSVHEPGSIAFAGHSFGAATTVQLVKS
ncbi:hypothetical protein N0V94_005578, partial [Neodidymelliopsis sp. IMI 364377]